MNWVVSNVIWFAWIAFAAAVLAAIYAVRLLVTALPSTVAKHRTKSNSKE